MVPSLVENGRNAEAFQLMKSYGDNFAEALQCLLKGRLFQTAIYEAQMHDKEELIGKFKMLELNKNIPR